MEVALKGRRGEEDREDRDRDRDQEEEAEKEDKEGEEDEAARESDGMSQKERNGERLEPLLSFAARYINDPKYCRVIIQVY